MSLLTRGKSVFKVRPLMFSKSFKWANVKVIATLCGNYYGREVKNNG